MALFGALNYILGMDTKGWTKGTDKAGKDIDGLKKKTDGFMSGFGRGFKRTGLGEGLEVLVGGGAMRLMDEGIRKTTEMVNKIHEASKAFHDGDASAGQMVRTIGESIPLLGDAFKLGQAIRNAFTGEQDAIDAQNKLVKEQEAAWQRIAELKKKNRENDKKATDELRSEKDQLELLNTPEGYDRDLKGIRLDTTAKMDKAKDEYDKNSPNHDLAAMQAEAADLKAKIKAAQDSGHTADKPGDSGINSNVPRLALLKTQIAEEIAQHQAYIDRKVTIYAIGQAKVADLDKKEADKLQKTQDDAQHKAEEEAQKHVEQMKRVGEQLTKEAETPIQKFLAEMKKIDIAQQVGTIDKGVHDALEAKYTQDFEKYGMQKFEEKLPSAIQHIDGAGQVMRMPEVATPINALSATAKLQLEEQRKANKLTEKQIEDAKTGVFVLNL